MKCYSVCIYVFMIMHNNDKIEEVYYTGVFKDPEFGGGRGSGGGADDTKYTESLQCYYCSYVFNIAKKTIKSVTPKELEKAVRHVNATESLESCLKNGPGWWLENDVYIKTFGEFNQANNNLSITHLIIQILAKF